MSGRFTSIMRLLCSLVVSSVLLLAVHAPTRAQTVAVFDFELIDTSVEGEIRGVRSDEQARLGQLSLQLRERLKDSAGSRSSTSHRSQRRRERATCKAAAAVTRDWPGASERIFRSPAPSKRCRT